MCASIVASSELIKRRSEIINDLNEQRRSLHAIRLTEKREENVDVKNAEPKWPYCGSLYRLSITFKCFYPFNLLFKRATCRFETFASLIIASVLFLRFARFKRLPVIRKLYRGISILFLRYIFNKFNELNAPILT